MRPLATALLLALAPNLAIWALQAQMWLPAAGCLALSVVAAWARERGGK